MKRREQHAEEEASAPSAFQDLAPATSQTLRQRASGHLPVAAARRDGFHEQLGQLRG
jgi:hypothetical protein